MNVYQSQSEEFDKPRLANRLPIDLGSYKFMGGEREHRGFQGQHAGYVLFSGPVQFSPHENQNHINFKIAKNNTIVRVYAEHSEMALHLSETSTDHPKQIPTGSSGPSLLKRLSKGSYTVQLSHATAHARKNAEIIPPRTHLTILVADEDTHREYNTTWAQLVDTCDSGSNFPLALKQLKQGDSHQLYYNYPLIKVSPSVLKSSSVLQTYNFRVNVTSRMYFEVGMHLLSSQITLQMTALNERGYTIQGKQRGNLNVMDVQVGPGDYSIALK